jgi:hypothetical protein
VAGRDVLEPYGINLRLPDAAVARDGVRFEDRSVRV